MYVYVMIRMYGYPVYKTGTTNVCISV